MNQYKNIELFQFCNRLGKEFYLINEWNLHNNFESVRWRLEQVDEIQMIVEATDAVHPYFEHYRDSLLYLQQYFKNRPTSQLIYYSVNYYTELDNISNVLYRHFPEYHAYYYPLYSNIQINDSKLTKKFLCLNKRANITRLILYKKFYTDNLIEQSFFSFLGEDHLFGNLESIETVDWAEQIFNELLNLYPEFNKLCTPKLPFIRLDNDRSIDAYMQDQTNRHIDPSWILDSTFYQQSFCSVISETSMSSVIPNFSEKTFRAIANGHPFIILGSQGSLEFLKQLGFDTFDDIFDNSYDSVADEYQRMIAVFNTIDKINSMDLEQLTQIKSQLLPRRLDNARIYQKLYQSMLDKSTVLIQELKQYINTK